MALTDKQRGVLNRMMVGLLIALAIVIGSGVGNPLGFPAGMSLIERLAVAAHCSLVPGLFMIIAVARMARQRFFSPEDIDGGVTSTDTPRAQLLQTLLQNTLEQSLIALLVYLGWALTMPATWLSVVPVAAMAFAIGRILFFLGYEEGAPSRALGFAMTFYPSVVMMIALGGVLFWDLIF
jgi:uncharacterized membrane protein YecN with MAPEG domain